MWTYLCPKLTSSAQCLSSSDRYRTLILSMSVCLPLSLTSDWTLFASSGRTKFEEMRGVDHPQPGVDGGGVVGRTVLPEQVLQDEDRHVGPDLDLADQILADHLPRKDLCRFLIKVRHGCTFR